jgi:hypothetical protein
MTSALTLALTLVADQGLYSFLPGDATRTNMTAIPLNNLLDRFVTNLTTFVTFSLPQRDLVFSRIRRLAVEKLRLIGMDHTSNPTGSNYKYMQRKILLALALTTGIASFAENTHSATILFSESNTADFPVRKLAASPLRWSAMIPFGTCSQTGPTPTIPSIHLFLQFITQRQEAELLKALCPL